MTKAKTEQSKAKSKAIQKESKLDDNWLWRNSYELHNFILAYKIYVLYKAWQSIWFMGWPIINQSIKLQFS